MTNLQRVAKEIKNVGLYDLILQDVQKIAGKKKLDVDEILDILKKNSHILEDYKQMNVEYNLSNIHIEKVEKLDIKKEHHEKIEKINQNLKKIKEIEKYTLDFEHSSTLIIIFSIEFFVLFSVQYFIVLLNLKEYQLWIYGFFASSILWAWLYAKKQKKFYDKNAKKFDVLYDETKMMLDELEDKNIIKREDIYDESSEEHV